MAEQSRSWAEPVLAGWAGLRAPALLWALRLFVVALAGSWIGFYLITPLPYLELGSFRATVTLHLITGIVVIPYLASLVLTRRLPGGSPLDAPIVALLGVMMLTTATSLDWRVSLEVVLIGIMAISVFYVLSDGGLFQRWQIEWAFMLAVLGTACWAIWVVAGDYLDWLQLSRAVRGSGGGSNLFPPAVPKVHNVGDHPNLLSGILAMSLPFFFVALFRPTLLTFRVLCAIAAGVIMLAMFLTLARSGWMGGAAGVLTTGLLLLIATPGGRSLIGRLRPETPRQQAMLGSVAVSLVLATVALLLVARSIDARPLWLFRESGTPRLDVMEAGAEMVQDYTLLGTGPGNFALLYPEYSGRFPNHAFHTHNGFLQTTVDMGVPGVAAMLVLAGAAGWLIVDGVRKSEGEARLSLAASGGALVAFGVFSLFESPNGYKGPLVALAAVGAIAALSYREGVRRHEAPPEAAHIVDRAGRWIELAARVVVPLALAGLLITWGRIDAGHYEFSEGASAANARDWPEAVEHAQRSVDLDPSYAIYRLQLGLTQGQAYQATGDPRLLDDAIRQLQRGVELEPRSAVGHTNLALLLAERGDSARAREEALLAIEFSNSDPAVVLAAGTALEQANWGDEAIDAYGYVLFLDLGLADSSFWTESPFRLARFRDIVSHSALILNPCAVLWLSAQNVPPTGLDRDEALAGCRLRIIELDDPRDRVVLAEALILDGDLDGAFDQLDFVVHLQPDNGPAHTALGRWYAAQGRIGEAREQWLLAGQLEEVDALILLGESYEPDRVPPEVVDALRSEVRGVSSQIQFHLTAVLYYRLKFFRQSPLTMVLPGEWQEAVPGRYERARNALARWEAQTPG